MTVEGVFWTRDEFRDFWLQCYRNRHVDELGNPIAIDTGVGSYPYIRASAAADTFALMSATAQSIALGHLLDSLTGDQLDAKYGAKLPRIVSTESRGYVLIETGTSGSTILSGDRLSYSGTNHLYQYTGANKLFTNLERLPIESVDPGLGQNLAAGAVLTWVTPRAGCYATCRVFEQTDGSGLSGGREKESDEEYRQRIRYFLANPAGHGNEGDLLVLIEESSQNDALGRPGHGVPVEKGFVYPAARGPGTCALTFTVKRDYWWQSRVPTALEMQTVLQYAAQYMPRDLSMWVVTPEAQSTTVCVSVTLSPQAAQWDDYTTWPTYSAINAGRKVITAATDATHFSIGTDDADYTGETAPVSGNTIGVLDRSTGTFFRKTIATVSGSGPWVITVDTGVGLSDTTFTPVVGSTVSPWTDAIQLIAESIGAHVSGLGPGELYTNPGGDGRKQKREPPPTPGTWHNAITGRVAYDIVSDVPAVIDASLLGASPSVLSATDVPVLVNLHGVPDIGVYRSNG